MTAPQSSSRLRPFKPIPFGRYTLLTGLAAGGMGEVFLARLEGSAGFEKLCVIKKILPQLAEDPQFRERFLNEAKTLVHLQHGSIAQVLDSGLEDGEPFLAIEFVDGKDLRRIAAKVRERQQPMPLTLTLFVMSRVLDALAYAHRKRGEDDREIGLVHRDISPQNVLISYEGEVKVIDFGLAKSRLNAQKTHPSIVLGKFLYMAPEQARHQQVDRRTDLYAVGLCLYELLAGKNPFEGVHPGELMQKVSAPQIPALRQVDPLIPPAVDALVMRALAVDPEERYQSAEEFRTQLLSCLFEIDRNVGAENVSAFMREAFAAEYQTERRLLSGLREAPVTTLAPPPSNPLQETGVFSALPPDELTPAPEASLAPEPSHKTVLEVKAPELARGPGRAPPPHLPPTRPERKTMLDPRPKGMTEGSRPPLPPVSRAAVPTEPSRPPVPPTARSAIPVAQAWDAPSAQGWVPEPKREVSRPPLPPGKPNGGDAPSIQEPKREPLRPAVADSSSGRPTVEAPAVSLSGNEPKLDTDPRAEVVLPPVAAKDDTDPRVVVDELAKLRGEQDTQPRANVAELEAERNRAARVAARANRPESSAKLPAADLGKPAALDRPEGSGKLAAAERAESGGTSPAADRQERSGKFAAAERAESPVADRQERSGKFTAADRAEGSGKFAAADRREASGKGLAADRQEGSGKGRPRPAARPTAAEPRHDTPLHTIEIPRAVAPRPTPPASRPWLLFAVGLLVPVLLGLAYVLFFHRPAQIAPAPGKLRLPPAPVAPAPAPVEEREKPRAPGDGAAAKGEAPASEPAPAEAEAPANAPAPTPEPAAPPAESLSLPPTDAPKPRPAPTPSAPKKTAKKPARAESEGHREWLALKAAFERLKRDRSCESSGMGILCTRYRSLEKDVRAAEEAGTEDELIPRIKLLAAAVAEKAAE